MRLWGADLCFATQFVPSLIDAGGRNADALK